MSDEMGVRLTHLQQILRSLCSESVWNYAVFWKINHGDPMMLTWGDGYPTNCETFDRSDQIPSNGNFGISCDAPYMQDPLGLALAKMSSLVYALGEGIIGQVAVTGNYQWIFADKPTLHCWSPSEYCNGWQTQFLCGIKTIAIVAIVPYGVVQLGSLQRVPEDMKLVAHIKDAFYSAQKSYASICYPKPFTTQSSSCLTVLSGSEIVNYFPPGSDTVAIGHRNIDTQSYSLPSLGETNYVPQDILPLVGVNLKKTVNAPNEHVGVVSTILRDHDRKHFLHTKCTVFHTEQQKQVQKEPLNKEESVGETGCSRNIFIHSGKNDGSIPHNNFSENQKVDTFRLPLNEFVNYPFLPSRHIGLEISDQFKCDRFSHLPEKLPLPKLVKTQMVDSEVSCIDTVNSSLRFSTGCELHEALGPDFKKQQEGCLWSESEKTEPEMVEQVGREASRSFIKDSGTDYLLQAVVSNSCTSSSYTKRENSFYKSTKSLLTSGKTLNTPINVKHGSVLASKSVVHCDLHVEDAYKNLKSVVCNMETSKDTPPITLSTTSTCSEMLTPPMTLSTSSTRSEMLIEPTKVNKKRAKPGESCRPRPRDRQLIQDRVKELRNLVPNGTKCSIDSLLERTIKHMLFLRSVTKHAKNLHTCNESKFGHNKMSLLGSCSQEHGSSWALDVGGEICPLIVENLNMNGQMLVEMLCEECSLFLEIAEAIRSLGLTILKGVTEVRGENMWACFVVEGRNNRSMHRMDVLWSLLQLLQTNCNFIVCCRSTTKNQTFDILKTSRPDFPSSP